MAKKSCVGFCLWKSYVRYLMKIKFPDKPLKFILKWHNKNKKSWEDWKKDPKFVANQNAPVFKQFSNSQKKRAFF